MSEEAMIGGTFDDATSDTRTDHPAADTDEGILTREDEALMDHWRLNRVRLLDTAGHSEQDATRIATDSLLEHIRGNHVPDASTRRVLARIAQLAYAGEPGQWAMETHIRERAHGLYAGASAHDAQIMADYHSSQALERQQCHTNDPQWLALVTPRAPASTPARTPTQAPTLPTRRPTRPAASSANRRAPTTLTALSTILSAAALACPSPLSTNAAPPGPAHRGARCITACSVAAISLLRATMTSTTRGPAAPPPPPIPHAAGTTDAAPIPPARRPAPGALPRDASPHADHHTDPATSGNTDPTARDHPGPTTDTHAHTASDDPPAPCQGRPGENSNNAPASEPRSRDAQDPAAPPTPARACTTGTLAALAAATMMLALALDTRPRATQHHGTPRRVIRRATTAASPLQAPYSSPP